MDACIECHLVIVASKDLHMVLCGINMLVGAIVLLGKYCWLIVASWTNKRPNLTISFVVILKGYLDVHLNTVALKESEPLGHG